MTRKEFARRFSLAVEECFCYTKPLLVEDLPKRFLYNLYMNLYENNKRVENHLRLTFEEAVDKLYRDSGVPKWVDVSVVKVDGNVTIMRCDYSKDLVSDDSKIQFADERLSPFKSSGPGFHDLDKLSKIKKGEKVTLDDFDE